MQKLVTHNLHKEKLKNIERIKRENCKYSYARPFVEFEEDESPAAVSFQADVVDYTLTLPDLDDINLSTLNFKAALRYFTVQSHE